MMNPSSHQYTVHILVWEQAAVFAQPLRETVFVHEQGVRIEEEGRMGRSFRSRHRLWRFGDGRRDRPIAAAGTGNAGRGKDRPDGGTKRIAGERCGHGLA